MGTELHSTPGTIPNDAMKRVHETTRAKVASVSVQANLAATESDNYKLTFAADLETSIDPNELPGEMVNEADDKVQVVVIYK